MTRPEMYGAACGFGFAVPFVVAGVLTVPLSTAGMFLVAAGLPSAFMAAGRWFGRQIAAEVQS